MKLQAKRQTFGSRGKPIRGKRQQTVTDYLGYWMRLKNAEQDRRNERRKARALS